VPVEDRKHRARRVPHEVPAHEEAILVGFVEGVGVVAWGGGREGGREGGRVGGGEGTREEGQEGGSIVSGPLCPGRKRARACGSKF
jgi:hypothetical protein